MGRENFTVIDGKLNKYKTNQEDTLENFLAEKDAIFARDNMILDAGGDPNDYRDVVKDTAWMIDEFHRLTGIARWDERDEDGVTLSRSKKVKEVRERLRKERLEKETNA